MDAGSNVFASGDRNDAMERRRFMARGGSMAAAATVGIVAATAVTASPAAAQSFQPIFLPVGPIRVYDSRKDGRGKISAGQTRRLTGGVLPEDFAQLFNLTVTGTVSSGFLAVYPGDQQYAGTSSVNWFGPNQTICNNAYTAFDLNDGGINVRCGSGSTHFVLDLVGALTLIDFGGAAELKVAGASPAARTAINSRRTYTP